MTTIEMNKLLEKAQSIVNVRHEAVLPVLRMIDNSRPSVTELNLLITLLKEYRQAVFPVTQVLK